MGGLLTVTGEDPKGVFGRKDDSNEDRDHRGERFHFSEIVTIQDGRWARVKISDPESGLKGLLDEYGFDDLMGGDSIPTFDCLGFVQSILLDPSDL